MGMNRVNSNKNEVYDVNECINELCINYDVDPELPEYEGDGFDAEEYKSDLIKLSHNTIDDNWGEFGTEDLPTIFGLVEHFIGCNSAIPVSDFHESVEYAFWYAADSCGFYDDEIAAYLD